MRTVTANSYKNYYTSSTDAAASLQGMAQWLVDTIPNLSIDSTADVEGIRHIYLTFDENPCHALCLFYGASTVNEGKSFLKGMLCWRDSSGSAWVNGDTMFDKDVSSYNHYMENTACGLRVNHVYCDDFTMLSFTHIASGIYNAGCFGVSKFVDHFTSEQRTGCMFTIAGEGVGIFNLNFSVCGADGSAVAAPSDVIPIGGYSYPSRDIYVASPYIISSKPKDFYGYAVNKDFLYAIYDGTYMPNSRPGSSFTISGQKFTQVPGFYVSPMVYIRTTT